MGRQFMVDPYLNHGLKSSDRSFFYNEVVVGFHDQHTSVAVPATAAAAADSDAVINDQMAKAAVLPKITIDGWLSSAVSHSRRAHNITADAKHVLRPSSSWLSPADLASVESFDVAANHVLRGYDFNNHPYIAWMLHPATTREQFAATQVPFKFAVERFSQPLAAVVSKIERTPDRFSVVENLAEEHGLMGSGASHVVTFSEFLTAMGVSLDVIRSCVTPTHVHAFNDALLGHCAIRSPEAGAAALGMIGVLAAAVAVAVAVDADVAALSGVVRFTLPLVGLFCRRSRGSVRQHQRRHQ